MRQKLFCHFALFSLLLLAASGCHKEAAIAPVGPEADICARSLQDLALSTKAWADANSKTADDTPTTADILPYIRRMPACPGGGTYTQGKVGEAAACSIGAHNEDL